MTGERSTTTLPDHGHTNTLHEDQYSVVVHHRDLYINKGNEYLKAMLFKSRLCMHKQVLKYRKLNLCYLE